MIVYRLSFIMRSIRGVCSGTSDAPNFTFYVHVKTHAARFLSLFLHQEQADGSGRVALPQRRGKRSRWSHQCWTSRPSWGKAGSGAEDAATNRFGRGKTCFFVLSPEGGDAWQAEALRIHHHMQACEGSSRTASPAWY